MTSVVYYVVRQRLGWSVEQGGMVRSGHATREAAIEHARLRVASASGRGEDCRLRIQEDCGGWREERSFSPTRAPGERAG